MRISRLAATALVAAAAGCSGFEPRPITVREVLRDLDAVRLEDVARLEEAARLEAGAPATPTATARFDATDGLSEDEAVVAALLLNPGLAAVRRARGVAEGELVAAGLLENPELSVGWLHLDDFTKSLATSGFDIGLSWSPPRPGEIAAREARAQARIDQARAEVGGAEIRLAADTRRAFAAVVAAEERRSLAEAALAVTARLRDALRERDRAGDASLLDVRIAALEHADARRARTTAATAHDLAEVDLTRLLGLPPRAAPRLDLRADPLRRRDVPEDRAALEETMLARRPDLDLARRAHEETEAELALASLRRIPWPRFGPTFMRDELDGKIQNRYGLSLGIELPIAHLNQGEIARLEAERERARARFTAALHAARAEVEEAHRRALGAALEARLLEDEAVPAAREVLALAEGGLAAGALDLLRAVAVARHALHIRAQSIDARLAARQAVIDLERAIGAPLPARAGAPPQEGR